MGLDSLLNSVDLCSRNPWRWWRAGAPPPRPPPLPPFQERQHHQLSEQGPGCQDLAVTQIPPIYERIYQTRKNYLFNQF